MSQYKGFLTVSDLDGTLINTKQQISNENKAAIEKYISEGGLFAVATGRTEINALPYVKQIPVNCPCILYNGAMIYDFKEKKIVRCTYLESSKLKDIIKYVLGNFPTTCIQIFTEGMIHIVSGKDTIDEVLIREKQVFKQSSFEEVSSLSWIKIIFEDEHEVLLKVEEAFEKMVDRDVYDAVFSTGTYLEILPDGVSKGKALLELAQEMGINENRTVAIGDYCNDIEMVQYAALGVATANAHQSLKQVANVITVSNDEHAICALINEEIPKYDALELV